MSFCLFIDCCGQHKLLVIVVLQVCCPVLPCPGFKFPALVYVPDPCTQVIVSCSVIPVPKSSCRVLCSLYPSIHFLVSGHLFPINQLYSATYTCYLCFTNTIHCCEYPDYFLLPPTLLCCSIWFHTAIPCISCSVCSWTILIYLLTNLSVAFISHLFSAMFWTVLCCSHVAKYLCSRPSCVVYYPGVSKTLTLLCLSNQTWGTKWAPYIPLEPALHIVLLSGSRGPLQLQPLHPVYNI